MEQMATRLAFLTLLLGSTFAIEYEYISPDLVPELQYLDPDVDPCENFYQYACGNFEKVRPKPDGKHIWDHFVILQEEIHALMRIILESPRTDSEPIALQKAKAAYKSCVDTDYLDLLRTPQRAVLDDLGPWPLLHSNYQGPPVTPEEVGRIVAKYGVPLFFTYQILPNYYSSADNMIYINRDALSNPQTYYPRFQPKLDDYLEQPKSHHWGARDGSAVTPFETFIRTVAFRLRDLEGTWRADEEIQRDISETINFMVKLQAGGIPMPELSKAGNLTTVMELQEWTNGLLGDDVINWKDYFTNLFSETGVQIEDAVTVMHTPYLTYGVLNLLKQTEPRVLRNFVMVRLLTYMAPDGDRVQRDAFDLYYRRQNYDVFPRWEYCLRKVIGYPDRIDYSIALAYEYQRYHFNVNKLAAAADLVTDLMDAFADMLSEASWIDDATRENALRKLDNMYTLLGYPEYTEDPDLLDQYYDGLRVCTWEHFGNSQRARSFGQTKLFKQIGEARSRETWNLSPLEVNAFYNRATNRILLPVSVLNGVFFEGNISTLDYGRIGAVIGHEITHGYDKEGRLYNEEGVVSNWWSKETEVAFTKRMGCFVDQYGEYYIEEIGQYVNATQTLNENIADNGGLRQAYKALQKLKEKSATLKTVQNFTPEQLFFIGYGTMWCMTESDYYLEQMHASGAHAPGRFRVIGTVSNMQEFADAFNCPVGSKMNPRDKCVLW